MPHVLPCVPLPAVCFGASYLTSPVFSLFSLKWEGHQYCMVTGNSRQAFINKIVPVTQKHNSSLLKLLVTGREMLEVWNVSKQDQMCPLGKMTKKQWPVKLKILISKRQRKIIVAWQRGSSEQGQPLGEKTEKD